MLIFFGFFDSDVSWQRVLEDYCDSIVDFKSTEKMFSVDFDRLNRDSLDFRINMILNLYT